MKLLKCFWKFVWVFLVYLASYLTYTLGLYSRCTIEDVHVVAHKHHQLTSLFSHFTPHWYTLLTLHILILTSAYFSPLTSLCSSFILHFSIRFSQLTFHRSLLTVPFLLYTAHCSLLSSHSSRLKFLCWLLTASHSSLVIPHCYIITVHSSFLTTHFSFFTDNSSLHTTYFLIISSYSPLLSFPLPKDPNSFHVLRFARKSSFYFQKWWLCC